MSAPTIVRPHGHDASVFVVSVSGGKDSTATVLALREAGIDARYVFADTGWEAPQTYEHLAKLERLLAIRIDRVGAEGGMVAKIRARAGFAGRLQRWCTRELKINPLRAYHDAIADAEATDTVSVLGLRGEESAARAALASFEFDARWAGYVWRPLLDWPVADVLAIHHRHGVPVNPLYRLGFERVGCMPCINATKSDVRLMAEHFPERVELIRALEAEATAERATRNAERPDRYAHAQATFFQSREVDRYETRDGKRTPVFAITPIDRVVAWSRTARGGVQLRLIQEQPDGGCFRWGLCDAPASDTEAA